MNYENYDDCSISLVRNRYMKFKQEATGFDNAKNEVDVNAALEMKFKSKFNRQKTITRGTQNFKAISDKN